MWDPMPGLRRLDPRILLKSLNPKMGIQWHIIADGARGFRPRDGSRGGLDTEGVFRGLPIKHL